MPFFAGMPDWVKFILILVLFFLIYLLYMMYRYNRVKKQVLEMQNSLQPGDLVMTQSGLYGTLKTIHKTTAELTVAENLVILIDRFSIKNKVKDPEALKKE